MMESVTSMDTSDFSMGNFDEAEEGEVEDGELIDDDDDDEENHKIFESEDNKLSLRAKRFGIENTLIKTYTNPELQKFHRSMGVDKTTRTEALHLLGTDNMKTLDVFSYFSGFSPASIEWLSDKSCNVVWLDEDSCAKALKGRSIKITGQNVDDSDESEESISIEDIRCALPPGIWRKGHSDSLAPQLFIRYATHMDKKGMQPQHIKFFGNGTFNRNIFLDEGDEVAKKFRLDTGNPWSDIARQWRHYEAKAAAHAAPVMDAREMLSLREQRKPKYIPEKLQIFKPKIEEIETKPTLLASRKMMHADIEERKIQERNKMRSQHHKKDRPEVDLRERLGRKRKRFEEDYDESDNDDWIKESIPKEIHKEDLSLRIEIDNTREESDKEWDDSKTDEESSDSDEVTARKGASDLRSKLQKRKTSEIKKEPCVKSVLRTKYMKHSPSAPKYPPLRIEIDNDVYQKSSSSSESSSSSSSSSSEESD